MGTAHLNALTLELAMGFVDQQVRRTLHPGPGQRRPDDGEECGGTSSFPVEKRGGERLKSSEKWAKRK
jgi:hypothetical protein